MEGSHDDRNMEYDYAYDFVSRPQIRRSDESGIHPYINVYGDDQLVEGKYVGELLQRQKKRDHSSIARKKSQDYKAQLPDTCTSEDQWSHAKLFHNSFGQTYM